MSRANQPDLSTEAGGAQGGTGYKRGSGNTRAKPGGGGTARMIGLNFIMALLIAGLALAGWFIANQQQILSAEQARVSDANKRIELLEERLVATDSALSQDGTATKQQIGLWESEIRKLWAVANDRNKKWIKDNERNLTKVTGSINGIEATSRDLKAAVGRHESAFQQQQTLIDQLTSLELQMQQIVRGQRDLVDKVNASSQAVASLKANLSGKVDDNSEAIQSNDAFRIAINSRLSDIERRLTSALGPAGG